MLKKNFFQSVSFCLDLSGYITRQGPHSGMNHRWLCSVFALKSVPLDLSGPWFEDPATQQCPGPTLGTEKLVPGHSAWGKDLPFWGADSDPGCLVGRGRVCCLLAYGPWSLGAGWGCSMPCSVKAGAPSVNWASPDRFLPSMEASDCC